MSSHCDTMKSDVSAACAAGQIWRYPADQRLLLIQMQSYAGTLGWTAPGVDREVGARIRRAFDHAMNVSNGAWNPAIPTQCVEPFCYNFDTSSGGVQPANCSVGHPTFDARLAALEHLYPCFTSTATAYNHSEAESALCREAYSLMATVYVGWAGSAWDTVPECAPASLDGAYYTSCGSCAPTSCPVYNHYVTPVYESVSSLNAVTESVLEAQVKIRDGTSLPTPTLPLMEDVSISLQQSQTTTTTGTSRELDKIFPSVALEFTLLNLTSLKTSVAVASFWGDSEDWP